MPSTSSVLCSVLYPVLFSSCYCFSSTSLALQTFSCPAIVMFLSCFPIKSRIFIAFSWKSSTYFYPHSQLSDWPQPVPPTPPPSPPFLLLLVPFQRYPYIENVRITRACCQRIWATSSCGFCFGFLLVSCWFSIPTSPPPLSLSLSLRVACRKWFRGSARRSARWPCIRPSTISA